MTRFLTAASIFLSAFLLFQVQPIMARFVLPWYGGSAAVWGACILFFQSLLFFGYLYAHWLSGRLGAGAQTLVHGSLLALSLVLLPIVPGAEWKPSGDADPMLGILGLLTACVGLPYFLLSSTSPLAQAWLIRRTPHALPYRFYALSNLASLGALLAYPVVIERLWTLPAQASIWSAGYIAYVFVFGVLAWTSMGTPAAAKPGGFAAREARAPWATQVAWVLLAALPSALSLAVTNHLTQNVAAIPLLWILPLAIYLLTLILCFDSDGWYRRGLFLAGDVVLLTLAGYLLIRTELHTNLALQLPAFAAVLFCVSMSLHGELVRRKPAGGQLTHFYLLMALGGALGGVGVGLGAPYVLSGYYELPIALLACTLALFALEFRRNILLDAVLGSLIIWVGSTAGAFIVSSEAEAMAGGRNFYGGLRVIEHGPEETAAPFREMVHGAIMHGTQFLDDARRREPTAYYAHGTGADLALQAFRRPAGRVGVIGLGSGAMAAYGIAGETWRYYELNPMVVDYARRYFTYLDDSAAAVETVIGDGRLSLEHEAPQGFSVLAVDAFSGDSIPVHLLSREAFELYFRHLRPDGVLAIHVSNAVLDLRPVVAAAASSFGKSAVEITVGPDSSKLRGESTWVLVADEKELTDKPVLVAAGALLAAQPSFAVWTDGYSNLLQVLR